MSLEKFSKQVTNNPDLNKTQDALVRTLTPLFNTPIMAGNLLQSVPLLSGVNTINHKLGRNLIGWVITRIRSSATIFDEQDNNKMPASTLVLNSSAPTIVDIYCF